MSKLLFFELSEKILDAAFTVHRTIGSGFTENVYEESMCIELKLNNITFYWIFNDILKRTEKSQ